MLQAMNNAVSGVQAHMTELDIIGNNVANVNTVAFKASRTVFKEVLAETLRPASGPTSGGMGGVNPFQVGLGVYVGSADPNLAQGSLQATGKATDVAIQGNGYLMASDGSQTYYTRDGSLYLDSAGNLVTSGSGERVLGWTADPNTGKIDTSANITKDSSIKLLPGQTSIAKATSSVEMGGNLDASAATGTVVPGKTINIYDSRGLSHAISVNFVKSSTPGSWFWYADSADRQPATAASITPAGSFAPPSSSTTISVNNTSITVDPTDTAGTLAAKINNAGAGVTATASGGQLSLTSLATGTGNTISVNVPSGYTAADIFGTGYTPADGTGAPLGSGTVVFDVNGKSTTTTQTSSLTLADGNGATNPLNFTLDFSGVGSLAGSTTIAAATQDGLPLGTLDSFSIDKNGVINGLFTNGATKPLAQLALADFRNPGGLENLGNDLWQATSNSGLAQVGEPGAGGAGSISSGFLESSNVDLPTQFSDMIVAERGFQANAKVITTSEDVLQTLIDMKR